jgi:hypothetical protein
MTVSIPLGSLDLVWIDGNKDKQKTKQKKNVLCVSEESVLLPALYISSCYA